MSGFEKEATLSHVHNQYWVLAEDLYFHGKTGVVVVPEGFKTDLATIPRILWPLIAPFDIARPAIVHDFLYSELPARNFKKQRKDADDTIFEAMGYIGTPTWKKWAVYAAVRLFGGLVHRYGL